MQIQLLLSGSALMVSLIAGFAGGGLVSGFLMLGGLLVAAALALPSVLAVLLAFAERRAIAVLPQWFWADTRQQLPGLSLALMALLLALSANVGVGTMVKSFRETFTGWLDQRLASELYVRASNEDQANRLRAWLNAHPDVDAVLPIWSVSAHG